MKDIVKKHNPTMGTAIEGVDRLAQTIGNVIKSNSIPKDTTVPDMKPILRDAKELKRDSQLELADHLIAKRIGYTHHGLYIGNNQVIHYSEGEVRLDSLEDFKKGCEIRVVDSVATYPKEEIIIRAFSRLGEKRYDLIFNNYEHFVNWCRSSSKMTDSI
ncbi:lecithin retinol acyltransferase family protein [Thermolongibacillus altinsuensis]